MHLDNECGISRSEALGIIDGLAGDGEWVLGEVIDLFGRANALRQRHRGRRADLCSITSAKTGGCPEDCSYCAQSARARAPIRTAPLAGVSDISGAAIAARGQGARRFCIVTSGRRPTKAEFKRILKMVSEVRALGLMPCATLGLIGAEELAALKAAGLHRYHHNLETSERFFPRICTTHTYQDKLRTIEAIKASGLSLCSGGIFGLGEGWQDRIDMALALREIGADSVPINFLVPIPGTSLEGAPALPPLEALAIVALYRLILPACEIRVCGGRVQTLGQMNALVFMAGADGLLTGDCLTTTGRKPEDDLDLIRACGMTI